MHRLLLLIALLLPFSSAWSLPRHLPAPGGVAVLQLATSDDAPQVFFNDRQQPVVKDKGRWYALVGIPLDTPVGRHEVSVRQDTRTASQAFEVVDRRYPTQNLRIPDERMVTPPAEVEARIVAEQARIAELKRHFSATVPDTAFLLPANGRRSARFGVRRVLNGEPRSPHSGLDVAVGTGTPVFAASAGTVLAVEDFYFTGGTVVIDHGQGVLTLYAHLSRVDVAAGQKLRRGETMGASGVTGRATGPHLHWVVVVGGTSVDPELFLPAR